MENFCTLLKRNTGGTNVSVEPFYLFGYVDEQAFRFDNCQPMNDSNRFSFVVRQIVGERITDKELTGKTEWMKRSRPLAFISSSAKRFGAKRESHPGFHLIVSYTTPQVINIQRHMKGQVQYIDASNLLLFRHLKP